MFREGYTGTGGMAEDRYCRNCGQELQPEDQFCGNCGTPVHRAATVPTPEADVPVPPPPQQQQAGAQPLEQAEAQPQKRWTAGRIVLACLGILFGVSLLIVVLLVILLLLSRLL